MWRPHDEYATPVWLHQRDSGIHRRLTKCALKHEAEHFALEQYTSMGHLLCY